MRRPFPFRSVNESVGAFVLSAGLVVLGLIVLTSRAQGWFQPELRVMVLLPEGGTFGLAPGADVEVLGAVAGSVQDIRIDPETERVLATTLIRGDFRALVRGDSRVVIERKLGLAGDSFLSIVGGTKGFAVLPETPLRASNTSGMMEGLEAALGEVTSSLLPAVDEVRMLVRETLALTQEVRAPEGPVMSLVAHLDMAAVAVLEGEGPVGQLLTSRAWADEMKAATAEARLLLGSFRATSDAATLTIAELRTLSADLNQEIGRLSERGAALISTTETTVVEGRQLLVDAGGLLGDLKESTKVLPELAVRVREEVRDLPGLVAGVQDTLREVERLIEAMQKHWLLRSYVDTSPSTGRISPSSILTTER
ncbi:MAG: ABC-type transporter Mla subunit MlaD [Planctomycetota bacterium]|jgi:ABC-type transporter Mla subunit MlaD